MTQTNFTVQTRGDMKLKALRKSGVVPANIFGEGKSLAIQMEAQAFLNLYNEVGESGLIYMAVDGETKKRPVLIEEVQIDPISGKYIHASFHQVSLKEKVTTEIPVEIEGEFDVAEATLVIVKDSVEVEALPTDLPEKFVFSAESLTEIGQTITYKDLDFDPTKVTLILGDSGEDEPLVIVQGQKEEVIEEPEEIVEGEEGAEKTDEETKEDKPESSEEEPKKE
ncbi:MAG: 50S ribosomal protein L25 [Candidatus Pacebacteria bacterium]|jgi:large subunit ribosomal protein L25|nr:50S ribosomal protein L25 [Candidatus Paceibacterota bacterium]MBT4652608.1 50S ribosomal protein L25 [Candidatus Paceibacterota bacterium]MBT6756435.1 50S ribosomal protein L25 [Candidatus Paceibacterota bacterium]MBT6921271.1 50S ribosomal protein L25 [Candidatus Paceibacterota bacterium]